MSKKITTADWIRFFPFSCPRKDQEEFINFSIQSFSDGKRFVIGELPTGVGKSAIAVTIARYLAATDPLPQDISEGAYILTTQKILQEQYLEDFQKFDLESIKSSSNYQCRFYTEQSCAESLRVLTKLESRMMGTPFFKQCKNDCAYKEAKTKFLAAKMGVTNFSYFLAETMYGGALTARQLLVIDEAHNVESEVAKFVTVKIEPGSDREVVKISIPKFQTQEAAFSWIKEVYMIEAQRHLEKVAKKIAKALAKDDKPSRAIMKAMKENEHLDKHICKINRFIDSYKPFDWVFNQEIGKFVEFKPVDVSDHADWYLFKHSPKLLILSATILDVDFYCETLGIRKEEMAFKSCDSPFPVEKRPIHFMPVGKMSAGDIERTLPKLVTAVKLLLEEHKTEKGLIHCHSYKVLQALKDGIKDKRLLFQTTGNVREKILFEHSRSTDPTVLVSPSMTEGIDLRDDLSRFQIFCKVPFPYIDEFAKQKMQLSKKWYPFTTVRTIVQGLGRSVRSETDYAITYILDGCFENLYRYNRSMFPKYVQDAVQGI